MLGIDDHITLSISLRDFDMAELLGIGGDLDLLDAIYEAIDWDAVESELTVIAKAFVLQRGMELRDGAIGQLLGGEMTDGEGTPEDETGDSGRVCCRLSVTPNMENCRTCRSLVEIDDIRPALDAMTIGDLPECGTEWASDRYKHGKELVATAIRVGLISGHSFRNIEFDGIDEDAYAAYYNGRAKLEGASPASRN